MNRPSPPEQKSLVGYTIGKCKLLRICGRGAMGTVYKGMHGGLDIEVAVKILPPHLANNSNLVERFLREAKLAARLNHANTVRVYDVGEESGYYYLVMEFIDGTDALELVRKYGPQEASVVADIGAGAARALASAHANNVIHRDIKPANLMLPNNGGVKVADFGLARALASESGLTMTGAIMGTPDYMAPEQAQGVAVGPKADVYSLGATLFHLFVGRPPFAGSTPMAVALQHVTNRIVVPEDRIKDDAGMKLTRVIHEMTQKDHTKRPGDLDAIASKLADIARLNRRTRKLLFEGATIFATTGFKVDAEAINKQKEQEAAAAIDKGRVESPHLDALRKAAEKARTSSPALPAMGPGMTDTPPRPATGAVKAAPQIPPELAELTQDMVREAKARARRSSGEIKALPRDADTGVRRATSNPAMSPHRDTRPGSGSSSRRKTVQNPEKIDESEWESYAAKSFPTFQKNNILDGSASAVVAAERHASSWDGNQPPSSAGKP
ncbi:MAG: serine/threonine protein kinase, partial [Planctomycetes bacterium]|nr:serine/threonine protein kinase [Planctomycetota bacterium]